jgi:hypothetical protein
MLSRAIDVQIKMKISASFLEREKVYLKTRSQTSEEETALDQAMSEETKKDRQAL